MDTDNTHVSNLRHIDNNCFSNNGEMYEQDSDWNPTT